MEERCLALDILRRNHTGWMIVSILSGLLGLLVATRLPTGTLGKVLVSLAVLILSGFGVAYSLQALRDRIPYVEKLCSACGDVLYWPRKAAVTCSMGRVVLCYTYATNRYYAIYPEGPVEEVEGSPWTPTDYYCVKFLGGRVEKLPGGVKLYKGEFEALSDKEWRFIKGRGRVVYSGSEKDPVRLARIAVEGQAV